MQPLSANELADLYQAITEQMDDRLLEAVTTANRTGELPELLRLLGMNNLLKEESATIKARKIVVLGESKVKESKLKSIAKKKGYNISDFEFYLGYNESKGFNFSKLRGSVSYRAVLVGSMPHSTPGKRSATSAIVEMESHPELYPPVIRLCDANGLKITNNSFAIGLDELSRLVS